MATRSKARQIQAGQLAFLPTVVQSRRVRRKKEAPPTEVQCFECRRYFPPDQVAIHKETGMAVCFAIHCQDRHVKHYEAYLDRRIREDEKLLAKG